MQKIYCNFVVFLYIYVYIEIEKVDVFRKVLNKQFIEGLTIRPCFSKFKSKILVCFSCKYTKNRKYNTKRKWVSAELERGRKL